MPSTSKYSIDVYLNEECHRTTHSSQIGSKNIDMFAEEYQLLIKLRSGIDQSLTYLQSSSWEIFPCQICYIPVQVFWPIFGA